MSATKKELSEALTWNELADEYDKSGDGRKARTLPVDTVFDWAADQPESFEVSDEGTIHKIL